MRPTIGNSGATASGVIVLLLVIGVALLLLFAAPMSTAADHHVNQAANVANHGNDDDHGIGHEKTCVQVHGTSCSLSGVVALAAYGIAFERHGVAFRTERGKERANGLTPLPDDRPPRHAA